MQTTVAHRLDPLPPSIDRSTRSRIHQARKNTWLRLIRRREGKLASTYYSRPHYPEDIPVVPLLPFFPYPRNARVQVFRSNRRAQFESPSPYIPKRAAPTSPRARWANSPKFDPRSSFAIEIANEGWFRRESQSKEKGEREGSEPRSFESISPTSYSDGSR